jgi:hypothetical protein
MAFWSPQTDSTDPNKFGLLALPLALGEMGVSLQPST